MKYITVAAAAINTLPKGWDENTAAILGAIKEARQKGVKILCLPELCITGYGCEDEFHASYIAETALDILTKNIAPETAGIAVAIGLPIEHEGAIYNGVAFLQNQHILGIVLKQFLAGDGIHYEPRFFKAWPSNKQVMLPIGETTIPAGALAFDFNGIRVGFEICEDAWVAKRPGTDLSNQAVDIILNTSASHFSLEKSHTRERLVLEGSRAFNCTYVYANLLGNEAGRAIYDGDCLIASAGKLIARSNRFSYQPWTLTLATIDVDTTRVGRYRLASFKQDQPDTHFSIVKVGNSLLSQTKQTAFPTTRADFEKSEDLRHEEFARSVALGLYDYARKTRTRGFALSLSGGADSAACAALVYLMAKYALESNPEGFYETFNLKPSTPLRECVNHILTCAYQGSDNSSSITLNAATKVAEDTGARFINFNISKIVAAYEDLAESYLGRPLTWDKDDITRQNLQARVRSPSIWTIANLENFLLLTTSNRSEAAVGYATMDGDTSGCLAPIGGIDKTYLLTWLKWAHITHLPSLSFILEQQPTAELRPAQFCQTDEDDLMPYPMLNFIQKAAVIQKRSPKDIFALLKENYGKTYDNAKLFLFLSRYMGLWSRNQWKRERYAPSFHLDDENLDPRSWCRYPILSGAYRKELRELKNSLGL